MTNSRRIAQVTAVVAVTSLKQDVDEHKNHIFSFFSFLCRSSGILLV